jgi:hypothetical protein
VAKDFLNDALAQRRILTTVRLRILLTPLAAAEARTGSELRGNLFSVRTSSDTTQSKERENLLLLGRGMPRPYER